MKMRMMSVAMLSWMALAASACAQQDHQHPEGHAMSPGSGTEPGVAIVETRQAGPHGGSLQQLDNMQMETVVAPGGLRLFAYDRQGQPLDVRSARGLVMLKIEGDTKRYRYDLFPEITKDRSAVSLAVAVDLSRIGGRNVELAYQLVGLTENGRVPTKFAENLKVPMTEAQRLATAIEVQRTCPASGQPLGKMGKPIAVTVGGKTVYVCCADCIEEVKANPTKYFAKKPPLTVTKAIEADAAAIAEQKLCPVMDEPLDAMGGPYKTVVDGRVVYLCCPGCAKKLHATPAVFLQKLANQGVTPPVFR
jgi:YHS domain-containing protein